MNFQLSIHFTLLIFTVLLNLGLRLMYELTLPRFSIFFCHDHHHGGNILVFAKSHLSLSVVPFKLLLLIKPKHVSCSFAMLYRPLLLMEPLALCKEFLNLLLIFTFFQ